MDTLYDTSAPKKPTNLSINSDLLSRAKSLKVNLSATLEQALAERLAERKAEEWKRHNKAAIQKYNEFVETHGCFGDEFRNF